MSSLEVALFFLILLALVFLLALPLTVLVWEYLQDVPKKVKPEKPTTF